MVSHFHKNNTGFTHTPHLGVGLHRKRGFTLLVAVVTTALLLVVSFVVVDIATRQLIISNANRESQYAFYAADSGIECALYWDLMNSDLSAFATTTPGSITCNNQTISTGSQTVPLVGSSVIGGQGGGNATSTFYITFTKGCVIVRVGKAYIGSTLATNIDSRGYNTCDTTFTRRLERGVTLSY